MGQRMSRKFTDPRCGLLSLGKGHVGNEEGGDVLGSASAAFDEPSEFPFADIRLRRERCGHDLIDPGGIGEGEIEPLGRDLLDNRRLALLIRIE